MTREDSIAHARVDIPESNALVARTSNNVIAVRMEIDDLLVRINKRPINGALYLRSRHSNDLRIFAKARSGSSNTSELCDRMRQ